MSMGWDYVSELWLPTGLLFNTPEDIWDGEPRYIDIDREKSKNSD
jgi:hypothetical protein